MTGQQKSGLADGSALPATSLIIASRNRPDMLTAAVESVLRGEEVPSELIIVDQSSAAHPVLSGWTSQRGCFVRYQRTASVGVSRARNEGIAAARFDVLLIIDDDILVTPSWFGVFVRALCSAGPGAVVTGRVLPTQPEEPGGFVPAIVLSEVPAVYEGRIGTEVLTSCSMAAFRSAFDEVGGFDERLGPGTPFHSAEDNDLGLRLLEAGYRIVYVPEAVVHHRAWRPARDYLPMRWRYGVGKGGYYAKHLSLTDCYMLRRMLYDIGHRILGFPVRVLTKRKIAYGDPVYMLGVLQGATRWLLTERASQR